MRDGSWGVNTSTLSPLLEVSRQQGVGRQQQLGTSKQGRPSGIEFRNTCGTWVAELNGEIAGLARRQGGHVTYAQLLNAGLGRGAIEARIKAGLLFRIHRGVYAVGHIPTSPLDQARGALLAVGGNCALCGKSAAAFWGLYSRWAQPIEVVGPGQHRLPTLRAHRGRTLIERDIRTVDGIRVTSPARTLLDIAPRTATKLLHRFHNELRMRNLIDNEQLIDVAARNPLHPGARRLRELAGASTGEAKRSPFEIDWQGFAARYKLPAHEINVELAGRIVDVLFTPGRLVVELDGWGKHGTRYSFEEDRDRDSGILAATGIPTMRITYAGLHRRPAEQVRRINAILARR